MASDQANDFNKRLSQWVASQGFWFQLRYSMAGSGMRGRAMFHLVRMTFRALVFIGLIAGVSWVFLLKRTESKAFSDGVGQRIEEGLGASELAIRGLNYSRGYLEIPRMAAGGDDGTFFRTLHLVSVRCRMGLLDGLIGVWDPGVIKIARMDVDLRAGSDDEQSSAEVARVIFQKSEKLKLNAFEVSQVNLHWGYSERTQGAIVESELRVQRTVEGWRLAFKGGKMRQNWLDDMEIVNLVVLCQPTGIHFETAKFRQGDGTVDFTGLWVAGGSRPEVSGMVRLAHVQLDHLLPQALGDFVEGSLSGEFRVSGSTNSSQGVRFEGQVVLEGGDVITLRDRLPLLRALSVMDYSRNYHRIDLNEGSFSICTGGGGMSVTDLDLRAGDLFTMVGGMNVRLPTQEEIQRAISSGIAKPSGGDDQDDSLLIDRELLNGNNEFSLRRAAIEAKREREGILDPDSNTLFDRLSLIDSMRELEVAAAERLSRMLVYEGSLLITLPEDAFERAGDLRDLYPADPTMRRIPIKVPLDGHLYELTDKQSEEIYRIGRRL